MKKLSFFLMAMLISVMSFAAESLQVTLDFSKNTTWGFPNGSSAKTTATKTYTNGDYSITLAGGGSGNGHYWNNQGYLMLGKSGATLTLPAFDFNTTKIVVVGRSGASASTLQNIYVGSTAVSTQTKGSAVTNTYAIAEDYQAAGNVYIFKVSSSHNSQIVKIEIYGEEGGEQGEKVDAPKFSVTETNFKEAFDLTISSAEGTTLKYTTDNTDPKTSATAVSVETNTANVAIPAKSTVVKAVAVKGDLVSVVASTIYAYVNSPETAYTVAEAMEVIDAGLGLENELYVKGEISLIEKFDATYGSITYWIKDEEGNKFECYSGLGLNKAKFTKKEDLVVGSKVVVCGTMKKYNTTYEFNYNNYIVSLELPVVNHTITVSANPAEGGVVTGGGEFEETDEITVKAVANENYVFVNWTENDVEVSTEAEYTFEVLADRDLVANFQVIPCTQATPVNWDAPIAAEANTDQWYAVNVESAIAAGKDLALTVTNPGTEAVEITIEAYANCPATELIVKSTKTFNAGETKTTTVKYDDYLADQVEVVYLHVVTSGDLTIGTEAIEPCSKATAINWNDPIAAAANLDAWYAVNVESAIAAGKDLALTVSNPSTEAVEVSIEAYADCPATELIVKSTSTINAGASKTTTVKYDEYLADQVEVVYLHVTTKGGEIKVEAAPATETVYFINNKGWSKVNAYAWEPENAGWPGVAATKEAEQIGGYDVYSYTADAGKYANVIFNNGSGQQTADLKWTAGKYVINNQWYTKEEAEAQLVKPVEYESVYFVDNQGWGKANIYTWSPEVGTWPGVAMKKEAEQLAGYDVYSYTVEKGTSFGGVIFNNGSSQTGDLQWTAGKYYVKDGWYTKEEAEAKLAGPVTPPVITYVLMGVKGDWTTGIAMTVNPDNENEYVLLDQEILEGDAVKVVTLTDGVATAWCGNVDEYSVEHSADDMGNIVLAPGKYDFYYKVAEDLIYIGGEAYKPIEWIPMELEITNLTTSEIPVGDQTVLQLMGRNDMMDADVMLFLNNYTGEDKAYEVNAESSLVTYGGLELTVMDGSITKSVDPELGEVFAGTVHASAEEEGEVMLVALDLIMYAAPAIVIELDGVEITVNEESAIAFFNATWEGSPLQVEVSGFEEVEFKEYPECWLSIGDDVNWVDAAAGPAAVIIEDGVAMLEGEFTSFSTGKTYEVMLSGKLPVKEEPVVEPTYTENKLNTFAFGLESELTEEALNVTYRLNNSNATSVNVLVYKGENVVATVAGTTTIGKNTVAIPVANLPKGRMLTWSVEVNGTSVEAPTQDEKMFSLYCPHGLAIDKDPESEYFGRILVADAMNIVKDKTGYLGSGIGAGLHAFNPSFTTDSTVYTGGNDFTRILASNGYQPWRVKISEDGRIFVSSLDLNGVVVWEVSKDLQTWTPVIAGTNDATDHNIYDAEGNFVAGLNCSMDVTGKGEDLKLLLYSTNNKGIAFNQSGYRLDEYALGTATTWTGTPKNILEGGKLGLVHTNVEFIYDGEGGYWFGASRAGNAGQPNLVHINAAGEQDYYTEDAGLYGGDGVLVHNGMLFKGKARTSTTVGNFGVWTIGKDADGKVTLTEKWTVAANGIGRNLNEFAVDYAENLYVVGNSGEKIIAYALPYSGQVVTPAAAKYAFHIGELLPEPTVVTEMVGVVKRAVQNGDAVIVLTHEADGTAHIYEVANGTILELLQNGVVPVDPENKGSYLAISDIAVTEDGKLVANNYVRCQFAGTAPEDGYKLGTSYYYIWDDLTGAPRVWFTSQATARSSHGDMGKTFAVKGTSTDAKVLVTAVHNNNRAVRMALYSIIDGVYEEPDIAGGTYNNDYYFNFGLHTKANYYKEETQGKEFYLLASPLAENSWIIEGELSEPSEFLVPAEIGADYAANQEIAAGTLGNKYQGTSIVTVGEQVLMVAPYATAEGLLAGVKVLDITAGLDAATEVATADLDAAVEATAAATAVAVAENTLTITLVADATIYTLNVELESEPDYMLLEDNITNLVIDLESMAIIGGPSTMWQVEVFLGLAEDDNMDGQWSLSPESSVAIMGFDARFIDGYVYDIDVNAPAAKAVLYVEDSGFFYEIKLNMTNTPQEAIVVVVEDATVQIDTIPLFGDMVDYSLKMTANWTYAEDGVTYPVLVEVPVYYPEATEPSEMTCTVTIGEDDYDPWLGFGEGTLTITTVDGVVTAKGIVANPYTGVAFDVTVSGKLPQGPGSGLDNININVKPVKMIKNGMLIINKGGREFNAQGATLK